MLVLIVDKRVKIYTMLAPENQAHVPVLCNEVLSILDLKGCEIIIDATFGGGGYSRAMLNHGAAKIIAFDRDEAAIERAKELQKEFPERLIFYNACFSSIKDFVALDSVDGVVFDFGVSSFQVDQAYRGFSFRLDGPLDMRMGVGSEITAAEIVNTFSEKDICDIIYLYGEEKRARQVAAAIIRQRAIKPFSSTLDLVRVVQQVIKRNDGVHPATLVFQALRIFVNNELSEINNALICANSVLVNKGKLLTVSFHSLEDRLVKSHCSQGFKINDKQYRFQKINRKVISPSKEEIDSNIRSRSAKLRSYTKQVVM